GKLNITGWFQSLDVEIDVNETNPSATSTINISGSSAVWTIYSTLLFGNQIDVALIIEDCGECTTYFGVLANGSGSASVVVADGGKWTTDLASVGHYGAGSLSVGTDGHVSAETLYVGGGGSGIGIAEISGTTSALTASGAATVGYLDDCTLT